MTDYARRAVLVDSLATTEGPPVTVGQLLFLEDQRVKTATNGYLDDYGAFGYYLEAGQLPHVKGSIEPVTLWIRCIDGENLTVDGKAVTVEGLSVMTGPFDEWKRYEAHGKQFVWVPVYLEEVVVTRKGSADDPSVWSESGQLLS